MQLTQHRFGVHGKALTDMMPVCLMLV